MRNLIKTAIQLGLITTFGLAVNAGDKGGNGGGTFVCRANGKITRGISYDLWAGMSDGILLDGKPFYLSIERQNRESAREQAYKAFSRIEKLHSGVYGRYWETLDLVIRQVEKLLSDNKSQRLPTKKDFNPFSFPEEDFCPDNNTLPVYETAIIYYDKTKVIDDEITNKDYLRIYDKVVRGLETETDLAALYVHEVVYKVERTASELKKEKRIGTNSDTVRALVAAAFSDHSQDILTQLFLESYYPSHKDLSMKEFKKTHQDLLIRNEVFNLVGARDTESFKKWYEKNHYFISDKIEFDPNGIVYKEVACQTRGLFGDHDYYRHNTLLSLAVANHNYELVKFLILKKGHSPDEKYRTCGLFSKDYFKSVLELAQGMKPYSENKLANKKIIEFLRSQ